VTSSIDETAETVCPSSTCSHSRQPPTYDVFGLIGTALSTKIRIFQSSSLKVVPVSPNLSYEWSSAIHAVLHRPSTLLQS
jgi:hypothetical protein